MLSIIRSNQRGHTKIDWLDSYHSFSFGEYYDPSNIHFGPLRVMNHDLIQPGAGFPTHPHREMEIVTIVLEGVVAHRDSTGGHGMIGVNEIQRMTAGSGIQHSEFNPSDDIVLNLLQIWFIPNKSGLTPGYEQKKYSHEEKKNKLLKVVSGNKDEGLIFINQDADIYLSDLNKGKNVSYSAKDGRGVYLYVIKGKIVVNDAVLGTGDAVKIEETGELHIEASEDSSLILFDLTMKF